MTVTTTPVSPLNSPSGQWLDVLTILDVTQIAVEFKAAVIEQPVDDPLVAGLLATYIDNLL